MYLVDENIMTRGSQEANPVFPLGTIVPYSLIQYSNIHGNFIEYDNWE